MLRTRQTCNDICDKYIEKLNTLANKENTTSPLTSDSTKQHIEEIKRALNMTDYSGYYQVHGIYNQQLCQYIRELYGWSNSALQYNFITQLLEELGVNYYWVCHDEMDKNPKTKLNVRYILPKNPFMHWTEFKKTTASDGLYIKLYLE